MPSDISEFVSSLIPRTNQTLSEFMADERSMHVEDSCVDAFEICNAKRHAQDAGRQLQSASERLQPAINAADMQLVHSLNADIAAASAKVEQTTKRAKALMDVAGPAPLPLLNSMRRSFAELPVVQTRDAAWRDYFCPTEDEMTHSVMRGVAGGNRPFLSLKLNDDEQQEHVLTIFQRHGGCPGNWAPCGARHFMHISDAGGLSREYLSAIGELVHTGRYVNPRDGRSMTLASNLNLNPNTAPALLFNPDTQRLFDNPVVAQTALGISVYESESQPQDATAYSCLTLKTLCDLWREHPNATPSTVLRQNSNGQDETVQNFLSDALSCSISGNIFSHPQLFCDGNTFEAKNIHTWLSRQAFSPLSRIEIRSKPPIKNEPLSAIIADLRIKHWVTEE